MSEKKTLKQQDIVDYIAKHAAFTNGEAERAFEAVIDCIRENVNEGIRVPIKSVGIFEKQYSEARVARNPRTGEEVQVPGKFKARFKQSSKFKAFLNGEGDDGDETHEEE